MELVFTVSIRPQSQIDTSLVVLRHFPKYKEILNKFILKSIWPNSDLFWAYHDISTTSFWYMAQLRYHFLSRMNRKNIFPGWPLHFHSCLEQVLFSPVSSWIWSQHLSWSWILGKIVGNCHANVEFCEKLLAAMEMLPRECCQQSFPKFSLYKEMKNVQPRVKM